MEESKIKQEQLLISKIKIVADRNERFAAILSELDVLRLSLTDTVNNFAFNEQKTKTK